MGSRQIIIEPDDRHPELMESCRALWNSVLHFHDLESERLARRLAVEIQHPDEVTPLAAAALTYELLVRTTRRRDVTRRLGTPPVWLEHARDRLQDAGRALPTLTILARGVGVHPAYLARLFRLHYGCSIGAFVRQRRVEAAATALLSTADTIAHIALDHGFADQSHFTRQFRRHIGLTPHEFRKRHRAG